MPRVFAMAGFACVVAAGCHHDRPQVDAAYFGHQVVPPGVLAKIRPGQTLAEVTALAPALHEVPLRGYLVAESAGAKQYVTMTDGIVVDTYVALEGDVTPVVTAAWGAPPPGSGATTWNSVATHWRASLNCGHGSKAMPVAPACTLTFHPYRPASELFTKTIAPGGVLGMIHPDATFAEAVAATHLPLSERREYRRTSDFDGGIESVSFLYGRLRSISYFLSESDRSAVETVWGPPVARDGDFAVWVDPVTGWRAVCDREGSLYVTFSSYWPMAKLLATVEILAANPDVATARRTHPELAWESNGKGLTIPNASSRDVASSRQFVQLRDDRNEHGGGRHLAISLLLLLKTADDRERALTELAARWGAPKHTTDRDEVTYHYPHHATATVSDHMLMLEVI